MYTGMIIFKISPAWMINHAGYTCDLMPIVYYTTKYQVVHPEIQLTNSLCHELYIIKLTSPIE